MIVSWGRAHRFQHDTVRLSPDRARLQIEDCIADRGRTFLAHGLGRSYGDVALNEDGALCLTPRLNQLIEADWTTGRIKAAAGLSIDELLRIATPKGWFVPVTPGTKFVTLGGAVANDVHGKNHHQAGSFGAHVLSLGLYRSDSGEVLCSAYENTELFNLTISGLGLTGIIQWVELQLKPIKSTYLDVENLACENLSEFFLLSEQSCDWPYTVMWVDCFAGGKNLGRGIFSRGRFADAPPSSVTSENALAPHVNKALPWPISMPGWTLNRFSISLFNQLYRARPAARFSGLQHYNPFFYPLDGLAGWNKLYGSKGFFQHQCIIPTDRGETAIVEMLKEIARTGQGSFLAVLKVHGPETSPGVMSFCREGVSLALDFANRGRSTRALLDRLDDIVEENGGRLYIAKDGRMSAAHFQTTYPQWRELEAMRDQRISSSFWRRVTRIDQVEAG